MVWVTAYQCAGESPERREGRRLLSGRLGKLILALGLVVAVALLSSCGKGAVVPIETGKAEQSPALAPVGLEAVRHDLAIISLDFDPPLRVLQIDNAATDISLLVAIDNKGAFTEKGVVVVATLRAQEDDEVLAQQREVIESIAPGQATIARFARFPKIPPRGGYALTVTVEGVPAETHLADNSKTLPLQLVLAN